MPKTQCQYGTDQIKRLVAERGAPDVLFEIKPDAIADPALRARWKTVHELLDDLDNDAFAG